MDMSHPTIERIAYQQIRSETVRSLSSAYRIFGWR